MPRIRVKPMEILDILKLPDTAENMYEIWEHIYKNGFLFNEFTLILEGWGFTYKVRIEGKEEEQKIKIKEIQKQKDGLTSKKEFETDLLDALTKIERMVKNNKGVKTIKDVKDYEDAEILPPIMFMQYAVQKAMNREYKEMPVTQKRYKPIKERKEYKKKEEYKLFDVIRKYEKHINHSRHKITCERWEVKGHFRHYKDGKVIYVKPYEKGKGIKKERDYRL